MARVLEDNSSQRMMMMMMVNKHYYSHDLNIQPTITYHLPILGRSCGRTLQLHFLPAHRHLASTISRDSITFSKDTRLFILPRTQCQSSKLAPFVLLHKWKKADIWDDVARDVRCIPVWCINVNHLIFTLLVRHYRHCVQCSSN